MKEARTASSCTRTAAGMTTGVTTLTTVPWSASLREYHDQRVASSVSTRYVDTFLFCASSNPSSSHSISILTNISIWFLLQSVCVCVCVRACVRMCVCVCSAFFVFVFCIKLYANCFGRTMLYMCIEYHI